MCAPSLGTPPDARRLFREVWALSLHGANIDVSFVEGERHPLSKTAQFTPEQLKKLRPLLSQVAQKQYERLYRFTAGDLDGKGHLLGVFFLWQTASRVSNGTFKFHVDDTLPGVSRVPPSFSPSHIGPALIRMHRPARRPQCTVTSICRAHTDIIQEPGDDGDLIARDCKLSVFSSVAVEHAATVFDESAFGMHARQISDGTLPLTAS